MIDFLRWLDPARRPADAHHVEAIAACLLMHHVSLSDGLSVPAEWDTIERALRKHYDIDDALAGDLRTMAIALRDQGTSMHDATRILRQTWSPEARTALLAILRDVIWADGQVHTAEEAATWTLASELGLPFDLVRGALAAG